MTGQNDPLLLAARDAVGREEFDLAWKLCQRAMVDGDPNNPHALLLSSFLAERRKDLPAAYSFAKHCIASAPSMAAGYINLGKVAQEMYRHDEAEEAYRIAVEVSTSEREKQLTLINRSAALANFGRFDEAEAVAREGLAKAPTHGKLLSTLGMCQLAKRQWAQGWKNYDELIGTPQRLRINYAGEPVWDGTPGKFVAVHGEQGIGDEMMFASMFPDLIAESGRVVIECDGRLRSLFARSFPKAVVYGTRWQNDVQWAETDQKPDASVSSGGLGKFFRTHDSAFTGAAYLKADPDRVTMWRALWAAKRKPAVGIAWTGGHQWTGAKFRKLSLEQLLPIFRSVDAHWVVLEYKNRREDIKEFRAEHPEIDIEIYPEVFADEYDQTAGLVASLDRVVTMQTAVAHLAGALGVPCEVLVPMSGQWRYGIEGNTMPWYKSVTVHRQARDGVWPLQDVENILRLRYGK